MWRYTASNNIKMSDISKNILLGNKDVITKDNEDIFLTIQLLRTVNELRPNRINNNFSLSEQFEKERNESLKFCMYGIVDSRQADTTNLILSATCVGINEESYFSLYSPKIEQNVSKVKTTIVTKTIPLSQNGVLSKNIFDKEKASFYFLFEILKSELNEQIKIAQETNSLPCSLSVKLETNDSEKKLFGKIDVPFLYLDSNGDVVNYGTETTELNEIGDALEINNDFPFFYDRHWIKSNFNIPRLSYISFETVSEEENIIFANENIGLPIEIKVNLDHPSAFGHESVEIEYDESSSATLNQDFLFTPTKLEWKVGEQTKKITVNINDDFYVEDNETIIFNLTNPVNATIINPDTTTIIVENDDIPSVIEFVETTQTTNEGNKSLTVNLKLDKTTKVQGQIAYINLNQTETTYQGNIIGFNDPDSIAPRQRIAVPLDATGITVTFSIEDDPNIVYEDTFIVLDLTTNPSSRNLKLGQNKRYIITVKDIYVEKFATINIPGDSEKGYGVFRAQFVLSDTTIYNPGNIATGGYIFNWQLYDKTQEYIYYEYSFTTEFKYNIEVINLGNRTMIDGTIYENGDTIFTAQTNSGYEGFEIRLPANDNLNTEGKYYDGINYNVVFKNIEQLPNYYSGNQEQKNKLEIDDFTIPTTLDGFRKSNQINLSSGGVSEKVYYLTCSLGPIATRYYKSQTTNPVEWDCGTGNWDMSNYNNRKIKIRINGLVLFPNSHNNTFAKSTKLLKYEQMNSNTQPVFKETLYEDTCSIADGGQTGGASRIALPFQFISEAN